MLSVLLYLEDLVTQIYLFISVISDVKWVFADDRRESNPTMFKFMAMAHAWKMSQAKNNDGGAASLLSAAKVPKSRSSGFVQGTSSSELLFRMPVPQLFH